MPALAGSRWEGVSVSSVDPVEPGDGASASTGVLDALDALNAMKRSAGHSGTVAGMAARCRHRSAGRWIRFGFNILYTLSELQTPVSISGHGFKGGDCDLGKMLFFSHIG